MQFASQTNSDFSGPAVWIKPGVKGAKYYPLGFTNEVFIWGARYKVVTPALQLTNGIVVFSGGELAGFVTNSIVVTSANKVINLSPNRLSLAITNSSGLFGGSVTLPGGRISAFQGALMESVPAGTGYFLGTNQSGQVYFGPVP
jgi:hypothetical protein